MVQSHGPTKALRCLSLRGGLLLMAVPSQHYTDGRALHELALQLASTCKLRHSQLLAETTVMT